MSKWILILTLLFALVNSGCSTVGKGVDKTKELIGMETPFEIDGEPTTRFSENSFMPSQSDRQYKRMTKDKLEEDSELHAGAGSMWVMDGQGSYLFAQNKTRKEGDLLSVKIEGSAQKQIETKVSVIKKLLKQLEEEERKLKEGNGQSDGKLADGASGGAQRAPAAAAPAAEKEEPLNLENVPTRIIEKQADGNYRIKGQQPFMIGNREYKVIVTGMIRPEDFNDQGVGSNTLLDPQYDVVTMRKVQ